MITTRHRRLSALGIALLGLGVRIPNLGWGLPDVAEEAYPLKKALDMWDWQAGAVAWNPQTAGWPSLSFYIHLMLQHLHYAVGRIAGTFDDRLDYLVAYAADHRDLLLLSRLLGVLAACVVVYLAVRLAQRLAGGIGGWAAGLLLAFSPMLIRHAHLITPDILMAAFVALGTVACVDVFERGRLRDYVLAGIWIGLGISCKYTPVLLYVPLYGAHLLARHRDRGRLALSDYLASRMIVAAACGLAAFLATSPFVMIPGDVLDQDVGYQVMHLSKGHFGNEASGSGFAYYVARVLMPGLGQASFILGSAGLLIMAWRRRGAWLVLLLAALCFFVPLSLLGTRFDRYMLPALMPPALGLAAWIPILEDVGRSRAWTRRRSTLATVALIILALLPTLQGAWTYHRDTGRPSTLHRSRAYIMDVLGPDRPVLAMEAYTPQLVDDHLRQLHAGPAWDLLSNAQQRRLRPDETIDAVYIPIYSSRVELSAYYYDLRHYLPFTHIVVSSAVRGRYLDEPERFPEQRRFYADLDRYARLVQRFSSEDGLHGPEIRIYAVDPGGIADLIDERGFDGPGFYEDYDGRLHAPHFLSFIGAVAQRADQGEHWSHAAMYYDALIETGWENADADRRLIWLERSAYTHLRAAEFADSIRAAELFLQSRPESVRMWAYQGQANVGLGDVAEGRRCYERCLRIAEQDRELESWRAWALERLADLPAD